MSRWPTRSRRCCAAASSPRLEAEAIACRDGGTYVCIEGPQFSSLAESLGFQARGADVIGMTGATEAKLAREAEISYATIAMVTDYDCWHEEHGAVDVAAVIKVMGENAEQGERGRRPHAARISRRSTKPVRSDRTASLEFALITHPSHRDPELVKKLDAVAGRVLRGG